MFFHLVNIYICVAAPPNKTKNIKIKNPRRLRTSKTAGSSQNLDQFSNNPAAFVKPLVEENYASYMSVEKFGDGMFCAALQPFFLSLFICGASSKKKKKKKENRVEETKLLDRYYCVRSAAGRLLAVSALRSCLDSGSRVRQVPAERLPVLPRISPSLRPPRILRARRGRFLLEEGSAAAR